MNLSEYMLFVLYRVVFGKRSGGCWLLPLVGELYPYASESVSYALLHYPLFVLFSSLLFGYCV